MNILNVQILLGVDKHHLKAVLSFVSWSAWTPVKKHLRLGSLHVRNLFLVLDAEKSKIKSPAESQFRSYPDETAQFIVLRVSLNEWIFVKVGQLSF